MADGVKLTTVDTSSLIDEIIATRDGSIVRTPFAGAAAQLLASGALADAISGAAAGSVGPLETWVALSAIPPTRNGQPGSVIKTDAGTHTDPVIGGTVANQGLYRGSLSPLGWRRIGDYVDASTKADQAELDARAPQVSVTNLARPIITTDTLAVMYLDNQGRVGLPTLAPETKRAATSELAPRLPVTGQLQPLIYSDQGVVAWIAADGIDFAKVSSSLRNKLSRSAGSAMSSGQSLSRVRSKIARMQFGSTEKLKILVIGDSWVQGDPISRGLMTQLNKSFSTADTGFMSARGTAFAVALTNATLVPSSGWTITNATEATTYPFGTGPDGQVIYTAAVDQTVTIAGLKATSIKILRNQYGGKWRYRVDGGAYTVVTDATGGAQAAITISGLTDVEHTVDIDTVGNTGTVALAGVYAERNATGIEINRFGAGGMDAARMQYYIANMTLAMTLIQPDLVITILATNDQGSSVSTPAVYADVMSLLTAKVKSIVPDCGILHVIPPVNAGAVVNPLSSYRDAIIGLRETTGAEYLSLVDTFGTYAQGNALGIWSDTLHLNAIGGLVAGKTINDNFIKL